jgi:hypothetical protein
MRYPDLVRVGLVSPRYDERAYKFCVVRDPFDRAVSLYHHLLARRWLLPDVPFEAFVERLHDRACEPIGLYNRRGLSQCNPQVAWLVDDDGTLLADDVGRFEDLAPLLRHLHSRLGISGELPHENRSSARSELARYYRSSATRRYVAECYAADFTAFGY